MNVADRPALGAVLARPDVQRRRLFARVGMRDDHARYSFADALGQIHDGLRTGRRWDLIANDLQRLAFQAADTPRRLLAMDVRTAGTASAESEAA